MNRLLALTLTMLTSLLPNASAAEFSYLALGDSYTIGEGVTEFERWPVVLAHALREDEIGLTAPRIIAKTGWTTDELSAAMNAAEPLGEWDFVSLLIGVNNQYRGRSVEDFRSEFDGLLSRAVKLAKGRSDRVIVLTIPDWGVTPFAEGRDRAKIALELDAYNAVIADICADKHVAMIDIAPVSRALGANGANLAEDGLHPGAMLYDAWVDAAIPVTRTKLSERAP